MGNPKPCILLLRCPYKKDITAIDTGWGLGRRVVYVISLGGGCMMNLSQEHATCGQ